MPFKITVSIPETATYKMVMSGKVPLMRTDLEVAGQREKTRIIQRTLRGVDFQGRKFAPYSTNGPIYVYPQHRGTVKARRAAAQRLYRQLGKRGTGAQRTRLGIRFDSYAAYKASLGRSPGVVDLYGPRAPHMLQAIVVRVEGDTIILGIYGEEALRASGHNEGIPGRLPQRRFFDISRAELALIKQDILASVTARLRD